MPDEKLEPSRNGRLSQILARNNLLFFEFTSDLRQQGLLPEGYDRLGERLGAQQLERLAERELITEEVVERFRSFLEGKKIVLDADSFREARPLIENKLKQEFLLTTAGDRESFRLSLEIDPQVQRALELMPRVQALLSSAPAG